MTSGISKNIKLSDAAAALFTPLCSNANAGLLPYVLWSLGGRKLGAGDQILETYPAGYIIGFLPKKDISDTLEKVEVKGGRYFLLNPQFPLSKSKTYLIDVQGRIISVCDV